MSHYHVTHRAHPIAGVLSLALLAAPPARAASWIEFIPTGGGAPCRTDRETVQPDRDAVVYWAEGLEPLYLDGAFERACRNAKVTAPA